VKASLYLFIFTYFLACAVTPSHHILLTSHESGHDVACKDDGDSCKKYASSICVEGYRIHNKYKDNYTIMRFQCLKESDSKELCSQVGIQCVL